MKVTIGWFNESSTSVNISQRHFFIQVAARPVAVDRRVGAEEGVVEVVVAVAGVSSR